MKSYRLMQAAQLIAWSLLFCGLGNAVFAADIRGEQGFTKQAETVVKKPKHHHEDDHKHRHHHDKDQQHHSTTTSKKTDEKPTFSVTMKNDKKK